MSTPTRIYVIADTAAPDKPRLVRAASAAAALRHVMNGRFSAEVASQDDLVRVLQSAENIGVESAGSEADISST